MQRDPTGWCREYLGRMVDGAGQVLVVPRHMVG
jgi:hypothetical protein